MRSCKFNTQEAMALRQRSPFSLMYSSNWFWTKFGLDSEICNFKKKKKKEATWTFWEEFVKCEFPKDYTDFSFVLHDSHVNNFQKVIFNVW